MISQSVKDWLDISPVPWVIWSLPVIFTNLSVRMVPVSWSQISSSVLSVSPLVLRISTLRCTFTFFSLGKEMPYSAVR